MNCLDRYFLPLAGRQRSACRTKSGFICSLAFSVALSSVLFAQGQVLWQQNGVCVCNGQFGGGFDPVKLVRSGEHATLCLYLNSDGTNTRVFAQRLDDQGHCLWSGDGVALGRPASSSEFSAVGDGDGGAIAAWFAQSVGPYGNSVWAQRVDSNGALLWDSGGALVTSSTDYVAYRLSGSTSDMRGGALVGWIESFASESLDATKLFLQRVDSSGCARWTPVILDDSQPYELARNGIQSDSNGGAVVVWTANRHGWTECDVFAERVDSSGQPVWGAGGLPVCTGSGWCAGYGCARSGKATVVAWLINGSYLMYAQSLDDTGRCRWRSNGVPVCTLSTGNGSSPEVLGDGSGGATIVWTGGGEGVFAQRLDSSGFPVWGPLGIAGATGPLGEGDGPTVASDGRGGSIVCWEDDRYSHWNVFAQRVTSDGSLVWQDPGLAVCADPHGQYWGPAVAGDGAGGSNRLGRWASRGVNCSVYAQRVADLVSVREIPHPGSSAVLRAFPSPATSCVSVRLFAPRDVSATLEVYDARGCRVRKLPCRNSASGELQAQWDLRDDAGVRVPPGVYVLSFRTSSETARQRVTVVR